MTNERMLELILLNYFNDDRTTFRNHLQIVHDKNIDFTKLSSRLDELTLEFLEDYLYEINTSSRNRTN